MFCQEYWAERGMKTAIARFHNVYGPHGTWHGGREKAPAAIARKVIEAKDTGKLEINIWGDGEQTRSFMFIDDCLKGIDMITHCEELIGGRNSDNTMIKSILGWEPNTPLRVGMAKTYAWIESQYKDHKAGKRTVL